MVWVLMWAVVGYIANALSLMHVGYRAFRVGADTVDGFGAFGLGVLGLAPWLVLCVHLVGLWEDVSPGD